MVRSVIVRGVIGAVGGVSLLGLGVAHAGTITVSSATVPGGNDFAAPICVGLVLDADELVAGTENELVWEGDCATMLVDSCAPNPAHGKMLSGALQVQEDFNYKALVLSFTNTDPIPAGELYCCDFVVPGGNPGDCCDIRVAAPGSSDPEGNALPTTAGNPGQVCVGSISEIPTSTPIQTSTPSHTPMPGSPTAIATAPPLPTFTSSQPSTTGTPSPRPTDSGSGNSFEDDSCAIAAPAASPASSWLLLPLALLVARKRRGAH